MSLPEEFVGKARRDGLPRAVLGTLSHLVGLPNANRIAARFARLAGDRVTLHGVRLDLSDERIDADTTRAVFTGGYESEERWLAAKHLDWDTDVIELGAGMGYISCYVARHLDRGAELLAVEADEALVDLIETNRSLNGLDFRVCNRAYFPGRDEVGFERGDTLLLGRVERQGGGGAVSTTTLEALAAALDAPRFNLVADIEGAELQLVETELDILRERCETMILELHEVRRGARESVDERLRTAGFRRLDSVANVSAYSNEALES